MVILWKKKQYFLILHHKYAVLFKAFSAKKKQAENTAVLKIDYELCKIISFPIKYSEVGH